MGRALKTTVFLLAAVALPAAAGADTVDIVHDGFGASSSLQFWGAGHWGCEVVAGVYMLDKSAGTGIGNTWSNGLIPGFCIELEQTAPKNTYTYKVGMPDNVHNAYLDQAMGTVKANYLRELWGRYYDSAWAAGGTYTAQQNRAAEAFAAAVWEIVYEALPTSPAGWNVTVDGTPGIGGFRAELLDSATANKWLWNLTGSGPKADLRAFVYQGQQDYLVAVPEPATVMLLGLGGVLSLARRRRGRAGGLAGAVARGTA